MRTARPRDRHRRAELAGPLVGFFSVSQTAAAKPTNRAADCRNDDLARPHRQRSTSRGGRACRGRGAAAVDPFRPARGALSVRSALETASALPLPARALLLGFFRPTALRCLAPQPRDAGDPAAALLLPH